MVGIFGASGGINLKKIFPSIPNMVVPLWVPRMYKFAQKTLDMSLNNTNCEMDVEYIRDGSNIQTNRKQNASNTEDFEQ